MIHSALERDSGGLPQPSDRTAEPNSLRPLGWPPASGLGSAFASCERGSVAVEFALASVPLMLMVFGFIATAAVFNTWSTMQSNTQYAARLMSTGQIPTTANAGNTGTSYQQQFHYHGVRARSMRNTQVEYYACRGCRPGRPSTLPRPKIARRPVSR